MNTQTNTEANTITNSMTIEIWSDVLCPFCYIGKRRFEAALEQFPEKEQMNVVWKSFQLDPTMESGHSHQYADYLAKHKGLPMPHVRSMMTNVTEMARQAGLEFHFDKAIVANSFDAHRLLHWASLQGRQNEVKELLLAAHFSEGKDISESKTLTSIAEAAGLNGMEAASVLASTAFAENVAQNIHEAAQIGVQGVPFFVFNRHYAVSGAQESGAFTEILKQSFTEWQNELSSDARQTLSGQACTPEGMC
jgi:predicted DsbA family dithiol-disulfide isomerase